MLPVWSETSPKKIKTCLSRKIILIYFHYRYIVGILYIATVLADSFLLCKNKKNLFIVMGTCISRWNYGNIGEHKQWCWTEKPWF